MLQVDDGHAMGMLAGSLHEGSQWRGTCSSDMQRLLSMSTPPSLTAMPQEGNGEVSALMHGGVLYAAAASSRGVVPPVRSGARTTLKRGHGDCSPWRLCKRDSEHGDGVCCLS